MPTIWRRRKSKLQSCMVSILSVNQDISPFFVRFSLIPGFPWLPGTGRGGCAYSRSGLPAGGVRPTIEPSAAESGGLAMAHKQVLFRSAAREKVLRGATQLADAVRITLGPEVQVRADPEEVGRADRLQRRRDHRQGDGARGSRGEPRRADAAPGGREDRRRWSATAPARRRSWRTPSLPTACATSPPARAPST